jgi:LysM domain
MVRSAAAILAVLILPSFALAQEPVGTHTVVKDDTLWDLAQFYYQNPFRWRAIYEANTDSIADPNLIYPGEVFVIPGLPGQAVAQRPDLSTAPSDTIVATGPEPAPSVEAPSPAGAPDLVQFGFRQARPAEQVRTIFYPDSSAGAGGVLRGGDVPYFAVTRDAVYSSPWLVRFDEMVESSGSIEGFATPGESASTIRSYDLVRLTMPSPARVGAELQTFRISRTIESVGQVAMPTGVVTVASIGDNGVIGVITKEYQRIQPGDLVRPVPTYNLRAGEYAQDVTGGSEAMVMGFAGLQMLNDIGHVAFLDLGSDDGVTIGDEFVLFGAALGSRDGSLQVIAVTRSMASARIVNLVDDVFKQGVVVRLARKMR